MREERKFILIGIIILLSGLLLFTACGGNQNNQEEQIESKFGGNLVSTSLGDPKTFNPIMAQETSSSDIIEGYIFEGLITVNGKTTELEPGLAKSWQSNQDGRVWTFKLREDVKWSDGKEFSAEDVIFTYNLIYDEDIPTSLRDVLTIGGQKIEVTKVDKYTVKMELPQPFAPILRQQPPIIPKHRLYEAWQQGTFKNKWGIDTDPTKIVGTGPFKIATYKPGERVVLERNPHYWAENEAGKQYPYLKRWVREIVGSTETQVLKFEQEQIDFIGVPNKDYRRLEKKAQEPSNDYHLVNAGPTFSSNFVVFNMNPRNPNLDKEPWKLDWFTNLHFRRAVAHAVDRSTIAEQVFAGLASPQWSPVSKPNKQFLNKEVRKYPYDLAKARQELKKGGFSWNQQGQLLGPNKNRVEFNFVTNAGNKEREAMLNIIANDLTELGMEIHTTPIEFNKMVKQLTSEWNYDAILIGFTGSIEPNVGANVWKSSGSLHAWNPRQEEPATEWEARIDQLFKKGVQATSLEERKKYYDEWQEIVAEKVPVVYTVAPNAIYGIRDRVQNTKISAYGGVSWNAEKLYLKE